MREDRFTRMIEQMSIFDVLSRQEHEEHINMIEPPVGTYVDACGAVICHIMRKSYIGRKVLVDRSTQSMTCFQVGIMEDYIPYEGRMRSIVYVGKKQRALVTHYPGVEIREVLPWDAYEERNKAIGQ